MSVSPINNLSSSLMAIAQPVHQRSEKFKQEFQQLGQDLQSGDLSAAQADFAILSQYAPLNPSSTQALGKLAQDSNQLAADLQSGNLSAAQQDYSAVANDFRAKASRLHRLEENGQPIQQIIQDVHSGNLAAAQQAYATLQSNLQKFAQANGLVPPSTISATA